MWIVYSDDLGMVAEHINMSIGVVVIGDLVHYTTYSGIDKAIKLTALSGFSKNDPFYEG